MNEFEVTCKYCGYKQEWNFVPEYELETMDDVIKYDYDIICERCGSISKLNEALEEAEFFDNSMNWKLISVFLFIMFIIFYSLFWILFLIDLSIIGVMKIGI